MKTRSKLLISTALVLAAFACKNPVLDKVKAIAASANPALSLALGGTAVASGGSYNLGSTALATTKSATFTISNSGKDSLAASVTTSGNFGVASQPSGSIAAGASSSFVISFTPTSPEGLKNGTVTVASNDPNNKSFSFTVTGLGSTIMLAQTGQTTPYPTAGSKDDGDLHVGATWPSPRFTTGTSSVTDSLTGLVWAKNANLLGTSYATRDTDDTPNDGLVYWQSALNFVTYLNGIGYDTHSDWRLPNRDELRSLINYGQSGNDTWLNNSSQGFSNVQAYYYWTSTSYAPSSAGNAWCINMASGATDFFAKATIPMYVLPVRGGTGGTIRLAKTGQTTALPSAGSGDDGDLQKGVADPASRFIDNGNGTITDQLTGLIWEKTPSSSTYTWPQALNAASASTTGTHGDWRVPNVNELESLLNAGQSNSTSFLATKGFSGLANALYWTSTTDASNTSNAWLIQMGDGSISSLAKAGTLHLVFFVRSM